MSEKMLSRRRLLMMTPFLFIREGFWNQKFEYKNIVFEKFAIRGGSVFKQCCVNFNDEGKSLAIGCNFEHCSFNVSLLEALDRMNSCVIVLNGEKTRNVGTNVIKGGTAPEGCFRGA